MITVTTDMISNYLRSASNVEFEKGFRTSQSLRRVSNGPHEYFGNPQRSSCNKPLHHFNTLISPLKHLCLSWISQYICVTSHSSCKKNPDNLFKCKWRMFLRLGLVPLSV